MSRISADRRRAVSLLHAAAVCYRRLPPMSEPLHGFRSSSGSSTPEERRTAMRIQCPNCPAAYELDDGRVPPAGLSIKCPKCKTPFTVHRPKAGDGKAGQKIPLPGTGAARAAKAPAARAGATGKQPGAKGAVPLPGTQVFASAPPPGAAPLLGHGDALAPPPRQGSDPFAAPDMGAVPLPGLDDEMPAPSAGAALDFPPAPRPDLDAAFAPAPPDSRGSLDDAFPVPDDTALTPKRAVEETDLAPKQSAGAGDLPPPSSDDDAPSFDFVDPGSAKRPPPRAAPPPDSPEMLDFVDEQPRQSPSTGRAARANPAAARREGAAAWRTRDRRSRSSARHRRTMGAADRRPRRTAWERGPSPRPPSSA